MGALRKYLGRPRIPPEHEVTQSDPVTRPALRLVPRPPRSVSLSAEQLRYMSFADIAERLEVPLLDCRSRAKLEDHLEVTVVLDEAAEAWGDR